MTTQMRTGPKRFLLTIVGVLALASGPQAQGVLLTSIAPAAGSYGESVTITGAGFGGPGVVVRVGGVVAPVVSATGSRVTFRVPTGVPIGATTVTVTNPGGRAASSPFDVSGRVSLTFDEDHRTEAIVGPAGGVVTAQSNGRTFTLTIPAGALTAPETIVLTPVAEIFGFPLERALGLVHFAPEGLQFLRPATLTVRLPPGTDTKGLIGISAAGNGENLHLAPFTISADHAISLPIPHFTLGGLGSATLTAINSVFCVGATIECRYVNALARAEYQVIQTVCGPQCTAQDFIDLAVAIYDALGAAYIPLLSQWFDEVLELLNTSGVADDDGLRTAGREFLAWKAYVEASSCSSTIDCENVPALAADLGEGMDALARAYAAALQRAEDACNDRRVFALMIQADQLSLLGTDPLPADFDGIREQFACELVITPSFPQSVQFDDIVPFSVAIAVRGVGPVPNLATRLEISDGCGEFAGGGRLKTESTDANGEIATTVTVGNPCNGAQNATEIRVTVPEDIRDASGEVSVLRRTATVRAAMGVEIVVTPQNARVNAGDTVTFTAQVTGAGPLVHWTASGGSITPGPSATATYTAGSSPGIYGITATSVDAPTESQTVAVTIENTQEPEVIIRGLAANVRTDAAGACLVQFDAVFGKETSCPGGVVSAPSNFTSFFEQRSLAAAIPPPPGLDGNLFNFAWSDHFVGLSSGEITSGGLTSAAVGGTNYWDENGEPQSYFPVTHAAGTAELRVEIEIRGEPAEYSLEGRFFHDNYPWNGEYGRAHVSIQFADQNIDFSHENAGNTVRITRTGTLLPGRYELRFKADSDMIRNLQGGISFNTRWNFRLRINQ